MSDSQTVTIPAAEHAATAETRPARLLRALAQNPEPLSTPALASLLAEPGRRRRLLASYDRALHRHEQAGHVERAGRVPKGRGRPAIIWRITPAGRGWLDEHDKAPALAAAAAAEAQRKTEQAQRAATERDQALDEARATFNRQTPRISRKRAAHQLRDLGCTLDQIGAVFHVSKERIRQDLLWDPRTPAARKPPRKPKPRKPLTPRQTPTPPRPAPRPPHRKLPAVHPHTQDAEEPQPRHLHGRLRPRLHPRIHPHHRRTRDRQRPRQARLSDARPAVLPDPYTPVRQADIREVGLIKSRSEAHNRPIWAGPARVVGWP